MKVTFNLEEKEIRQYIEGFEQKYPGVEVTYECVDDYENAMVDRIADGDYGDVLENPEHPGPDCHGQIVLLQLPADDLKGIFPE